MSDKKKLKKSLDARRLNAFSLDPESLTLVTDKSHPLYDERVDLAPKDSLVRDVMMNGILESIIVRKNGDKIEVVDGRQRVKAAVEANKRFKSQGSKNYIMVPAMVRRGEDSEVFGVLISANEHRQDDTVIVRAKKCQRMLNMGRSEEDVAVSFGVTAATISNWKKLLDCCAEVQRAVESGHVSMTDAARNLSQLPRNEQIEALKAVQKGTPAAKAAISRGARPVKPRAGVGRAQLRKVIAAIDGNPRKTIADREMALLRWVAGEITASQLFEVHPVMESVITVEGNVPNGEPKKRGRPRKIVADDVMEEMNA